MKVIPSFNCVKCVMKPRAQASKPYPEGDVEVYYGCNSNLVSRYHVLEKSLATDEKRKAEKFLFEEDKQTYIMCHGSLRLILARKLNLNPDSLLFRNNKNNKPGLAANPLFFNITHDRGAFAIAVSKNSYVGIDIENAEKPIDFEPLMKTNFSEAENKYISDHTSSPKDRFFLLWTRKEALLKSFGTGIINELPDIEVSGRINSIHRPSFEAELDQPVNDEHFIYSEKVSGYYISVALPRQETIKMIQVDEELIDYYLS
jgi:phosphopantetheine--protein transferase-like protein